MPRLRAWLVAAALIACAAWVAVALGGQGPAGSFRPASGALGGPATRFEGVIRLATYNIHWGMGADGVHDLNRVVDVLRRIDADVVVLNEVDVYWRRSGNVHQAVHLAAATEYPHWYFAPAFTTWASGTWRRSQYGNLLLSRFPIVSARTVPLPNPLGREPRAALVAQLAVGERRLVVIGTHLGLNKTERLAQTATLGDMAEAYARPACPFACAAPPVVVLGDFNAQPQSAEIQLLTTARTGLVDVHLLAAADDGDTFPYPEPLARIDYIFISRQLADDVVSYGPVAAAGSDHLPVVLELRWPPGVCRSLATGDGPR